MLEKRMTPTFADKAPEKFTPAVKGFLRSSSYSFADGARN